MTEIVAASKTLDIQLVTAGEKDCESMESHPAKFVKMAATDLHRFDFDGLRQAHGGRLKRLENISLSCLHWEQDKLTQSQLLVMQSAIIHLATNRNVCIMCDNCHMIPLLGIHYNCLDLDLPTAFLEGAVRQQPCLEQYIP